MPFFICPNCGHREVSGERTAGFSTRPKGLGFGLHMSSMNLRTIGGSIRAHSDGPGTGATFVISLPVETQASAAE